MNGIMPRLLLLLACCTGPVLAQDHAGAAQTANPADAVLQRYLDASGGLARLAAVRTRVVQSSLQSGWFKVSTKTTQVWPDRTLVEATLPLIGKTVSNGYDGSIAWATGDGGKPERLQGRRFEEFVMDQRLDRMSRLPELYPQRHLLPPQDGDAVVDMGTAFGTHEQWRFDAASGLLKSVSGERDQGPDKGVVPVQVSYDDYRAVDGLTLPFHLSMAAGGKKMTATVVKVEDGVAVDAGTIVAPASLQQH